MKVCKACGEKLANGKFGKDGRTTDGLAPKCYRCRGLVRPGETGKRCVMCLEDKDLSEFHRDIQSPDKHRKVCKKCGITAARSWNKHNKERFNENVNEWKKANRANTRATQRRSHLKITYNMTEEQYWELFDAQGGACAICGEKPRRKHLSVDHDHACCPGSKSCGKCVRGLLCNRCNYKILPTFEYHPENVQRLINYLENDE